MSTTKTRIFLSPPHMGGTELSYIKKVFESNYIAPVGPAIDKFETEMATILDIPFTVAVSSGTAAMHLAVRHLEIGPGDVVLASTLTFIGSVAPVIYQGGELWFIDSDHKTWNMDPQLLAEALEECIKKTGKPPKAIIPTDIYGNCVDLDAINKVSNKYNIPVIVDSAESLGSTYKGKSAGKGGYASVYSFNGNKIITTSSGGLLASEDQALINHAKKLATQAKDPMPYYHHTEIGYNYRMSNVLAAIGLGQLQVLNDRVKRCREINRLYKTCLKDVDGLSFMPEPSYGISNCWLTVILIDPQICKKGPEALRIALEAQNIESRRVWKPMHMQPVFAQNRIIGGLIAERLFETGLCLPSGTSMTNSEVEFVAETIKRTLAA